MGENAWNLLLCAVRGLGNYSRLRVVESGMTMRNGRFLLMIAGLGLIAVACGAEGGQVGAPGKSHEWGPRGVVAEPMGDDRLVAGTLEVSSDCTILDERGHQRFVLAWPAASSSWVEGSNAVAFDSSTGDRLTLRDTYRVTMTGTAVAESSSVEWVNSPDSACVADDVFIASDVTDVVVPSGEFPAPDDPIGGGLSSGTGVDVQLECPPDVEATTEEWYGPVELTLDGAVAEAFGDLVVGWIGDPFEIETTDDWSSWGLQDENGNIVAVATLVVSGGGWDPSHARYCIIPQPTPPPPPFTLYVSNQSFEDPTVRITITIDDQVVVDQDFDVEGQHNWITFTPDIAPGDHTLKAISDTGAELIVDFTLPDGEPRWAVVDYWYYPEEDPRNFTFDISDQPIGFG